ncbi:hypothetical protein K438DRAFT_1631433, partial [Mycena galopus ATCC 62051]
DDDDGLDLGLLDDDDDDDMPDLVDASSSDGPEKDDEQDNSVWDGMDEEARAKLLQETDSVKQVITKICKLAFAIIHSTTLGLPAWRKACADHGMRARLIPRDVRTRWNSLYDMLSVAVTYKDVINSFTGDRDLGYRRFDLSNAQ